MNKFKFMIGALLIAITSFGTLAAQSPGNQKQPPMVKAEKYKEMSKEERSKVRLDRMKKELNLSDDQVKKLEQSNKDFEGQMMKHKEEMKKAMDQKNGDLKSILTQEQYIKHLENKSKAKNKMMMHRKNGRGHRNGDGGRHGAPMEKGTNDK